jgi:hypothetical protein
MQLSAKLESITQENLINELDALLSQSTANHAKISVSGYEGEVEVSEIARKYFSLNIFQPRNYVPTTTHRERLCCDVLWDRVYKLYPEGDADRDALFTSEKRQRIFEFPKTLFKKIWPDATPIKETFQPSCHVIFQGCIASKEMVAEANARNAPYTFSTT